jgi:hypothetical protein
MIAIRFIKSSLFYEKIIGLVLILFSSLLFDKGSGGGLLAQNVTINSTGASGDASAMLDVDADNKGMLIPRVGLVSATDVTTIASPAISLLIYNTSTAGTFPNNVVPGFYYWDGIKWTSFGSHSGVISFADFYALMPGDNTATVAQGSAIEFPHAGPVGGSDITAISGTQFQLSSIGTYNVNWQVSISEAGQLVLELNGSEILSTVVGRATGTSLLTGNRLITTTASNSILRVVNPAGNPTVLTITTTAGGAKSVSASLVITRIQ